MFAKFVITMVTFCAHREVCSHPLRGRGRCVLRDVFFGSQHRRPGGDYRNLRSPTRGQVLYLHTKRAAVLQKHVLFVRGQADEKSKQISHIRIKDKK